MRFWEPRFYDFNVWSEGKIWEKLDSMHLNPVKRGLATTPGSWPWSSYRFYALYDTSVFAVGRWEGYGNGL
jgi:putative transposase